jgi:SAM-dependent methyltransferase
VDADRRFAWERRHQADATIAPPSPFVVRALDVLTATAPPPARRVLDLACGRGRHALLLAARGFEVEAVDFALPALATLKREALTRGLAVACMVGDVSTFPLPVARYGLVVVVDFLERRLFPALRAAVAPGGALLYETQRRDDDPHSPPSLRPEFLLAPGELDELCHDWRVLLREDRRASHHGKPTVRSGILAQRPTAAAH